MNAVATIALAKVRTPFQGVAQIVAFNWPRYVAGVLVASALIAVLVGVQIDWWIAAVGWIGVAAALWWTIASLAASHWVYDRAGLYELSWLSPRLVDTPGRWVSVHSGLDEFSGLLEARLGSEPESVLDLYDAALMTEHSIARARGKGAGHARDIAADHASLPVADGSCDTVFVLFAAHELREARDRRAFFGEVRRVLAPRGVAVVVEHLRDAANFAAFGPGFTHFFSRRDWLAVIAGVGLRLEREARITPFVRVFELRRDDA